MYNKTLKPLTVEQGKSGGELVPAKVYQAVCKAIYDLGEQVTPYLNNDGTPKIQHKIVVAWELNATMKSGEYAGRRFNKTKKYTYSLYKSADGSKQSELYKDLCSWRGKDFTPDEAKSFDIYRIIGANCMLNITHETKDGKAFAKIASIAPLYEGLANITIAEPNGEVPEWVTDMQKKAVVRTAETVETGAALPEELPPSLCNEDEAPF